MNEEPKPIIRVFPVDTLNGTTYMYRHGDILSRDGYANPASAWHDARQNQAQVPTKEGWRSIPARRVVRS
jgi:hypothetical protein